MKDLSQLVTGELNQRFTADATAMEKVSRFFGLKVDPFSFSFLHIKHLFPDTTVSMLKECFEALRLYDLAEILAKVKPRALCPTLSPEQVEKLLLSDRRTKNYRNMAVVVVDVSCEHSKAKMIETFFKDLTPKNEVGVVPVTNLVEKYLVLEDIRQKKRLEMDAIASGKRLKHRLEMHLSMMRKMIKGEDQEKSKSHQEESMLRVIDRRWTYSNRLRTEEPFLREQLDSKMKEITKLREEIKIRTKLIEDIGREKSDAESALLNVMDKWIQDQGW